MIVIGTFAKNGEVCTITRRWSMQPDKKEITDFLCREVRLPFSFLENVIILDDDTIVDRYFPNQNHSLNQIIDWVKSLLNPISN